jgi:hypothetical protein
MVKFIYIFFVFFISFNLLAQSENDLYVIEDLLKDNSNIILQDEIDYFTNHQIDLSSTSVLELSKLPLINHYYAKMIFNYLVKNKDINITDLKLKCKLSDSQIAIFQKCTYGNWTKKVKKTNFFEYRIRSQVVINDSVKIDSSFKGSNLNLYQRLTVNYNNYELGTLLDKDTGEKNINDFQAGYLKYKDRSFNIILGDFILEYGLGGVLWKGMGIKKSLDFTNNVFSIGNGNKSYLSSLDYRFFRGLSTSYILNLNGSESLKFDFAYSNINRTANIDSSSNIVYSLSTLGLYRNENEIAKKENLNEKMFATNIEYKTNYLTIGANVLNLNYNKQISKQTSNLINNSKGNLFSLYSNIDFDKFNIYNELTTDNNSNLALKIGCQFQTSNISNLVCFRSYSKNFNSPFGYGFGEFSNFANESGLYFGSKIDLNENTELNFFIDLFNSQGNTYFLNTKVRGMDLAGEIKYKISNNSKLKFRLMSQEKTDGLIQNNYKQYFQKIKYSSRIDAETKIKNTYLLLRIEYNYIDFNELKTNENGFIGFVDIKYKINEDLKIGGKYSLFSTNSYESAVWQYESVAPGLGQSQLMYGEGYRFFIYSQIQFDYLSLWIKYGIYESNILDDSNKIFNKIDKKINLQCDVRF